MRLLYPSDPSNTKLPDTPFAAECEAARSVGLSISLFSLEDLTNSLHTRPALVAGEPVLYRGWMLDPASYSKLAVEISARRARPFTTPEQYTLCHHLPRWYPLLSDLTPETLVFTQGDDIATKLANTGWPGYFVKDYVKSLTTKRGSFAGTPDEIAAIVAEIEHYRGGIEGGICVRRREELIPGSEQRFFVLGGTAFGDSEQAPPTPVVIAAGRVTSPFFSVDIAQRRDGATRIVEIGDGQVSDRKHWSVARFVAMLATVNSRR